MSAPETVELDDIAARALATILLEHTADTLVDDGANAADVLERLESVTGLNLDVCAAILMATSWLAGTGELDSQTVFAGAMALDPTEDDGNDGDDDGNTTELDGDDAG